MDGNTNNFLVFRICEHTNLQLLNFKAEGEHKDPLSEFRLTGTFSSV